MLLVFQVRFLSKRRQLRLILIPILKRKNLRKSVVNMSLLFVYELMGIFGNLGDTLIGG